MSYLPHLRKLRKLKRQNPSDLEAEVAKALYDLELNHKTLKLQLPRFRINTAKEVEAERFAKKGLVVFYPLRYLMLVRKVQKTLTSELEKRFPGKIVVMVAQRKITKRPQDVYKLQKVQRSRTSTAVNEAILGDLIAPCQIVARRWKCGTDGSKQMKVFLDSRDKKKTAGRLALIQYLYKKLTHRTVSIGFMWNSTLQQVAHK
jgi:small subunit ribosomal protein S7e